MITKKALLFFLPVSVAPFLCFADDLIFAEGSQWELVSEGNELAEGMAWDPDGNFIFGDVKLMKLFKVDKDTGEKTVLLEHSQRAHSLAFGPDGRLFGACREANGINAWDTSTWEAQTYGKGADSNDLTMLADGTIFFSDPGEESVWRLDVKSDERILAIDTPFRPNGLALSADQGTLFVSEFWAETVYAYPLDEYGHVAGKGKVAFKLATPSNGQGFLDGMQLIPDGRLLIGTALGIQLVAPVGQDREGPQHIVVPKPQDRLRCNYVRISPDQKWIYACFVTDVRRRLINPDLLR